MMPWRLTMNCTVQCNDCHKVQQWTSFYVFPNCALRAQDSMKNCQEGWLQSFWRQSVEFSSIFLEMSLRCVELVDETYKWYSFASLLIRLFHPSNLINREGEIMRFLFRLTFLRQSVANRWSCQWYYKVLIHFKSHHTSLKKHINANLLQLL